MSLTDAFNYVYKQVVPPQAPQAVPLKPLKPHTEISSRAPRGRTAVACTLEEVPAILAEHGADVSPIWPCGATVTGVDTTMPLSPRLAGALEVQMAHSGASAPTPCVVEANDACDRMQHCVPYARTLVLWSGSVLSGRMVWKGKRWGVRRGRVGGCSSFSSSHFFFPIEGYVYLNSYGLHSYGLYSYGLYSYGL